MSAVTFFRPLVTSSPLFNSSKRAFRAFASGSSVIFKSSKRSAGGGGGGGGGPPAGGSAGADPKKLKKLEF